MSGLWRLTVRSQFSAAHALRHYQGKCERLHGHNFAVEVAVQGKSLDPKTGMLVDFAILKKALAQILAGLDHQNLNDLACFTEINPSSENLARHIGQKMREFLLSSPQTANASLASVTVSEKETQSAAWFPADNP